MTNYTVKTVDEFIAATPAEAHSHLKELRALMKAAVPDIEEGIGYGKPYYKFHGWAVGFDVYTKHVGFEVWDGLSDEDQEVLEGKGYKTGSTAFRIRFDQEVPAAIIKKLVKAQVKRNEEKKK